MDSSENTLFVPLLLIQGVKSVFHVIELLLGLVLNTSVMNRLFY